MVALGEDSLDLDAQLRGSTLGGLSKGEEAVRAVRRQGVVLDITVAEMRGGGPLRVLAIEGPFEEVGDGLLVPFEAHVMTISQ
jgi:hypothetical protein